MMCRRRHYDLLKAGLEGNGNVRFILVNGKGHNPNYTEEAVKYLGEFSRARAKLLKNKKATGEDKERFVSSFDWDKMTLQDEAIWKEIFAHLDNFGNT